MTKPSSRFSIRTRILIVLGLTLIYIGLFVSLFPITGDVVAAFGLLPLGFAGWFFGRRIGFFSYIVSFFVNMGLFVGFAGRSWTGIYTQWPGTVISIIVAVGMGWISELVTAARQRTAELNADRQRLRDEIEQRKVIEAALEQARDDAEAANRAKSTFLATMSHELRTPLNAILGYSEMIREQAEHDGLHDYIPDLNRIHESGTHLLALISDILDLSKIEAGKIELQYEPLNVEDLIKDLATMVRPQMIVNHNNFQVERIGTLGTIHTDLTRLRQILLNILQNAAKFTLRGDIHFRVERDDDANRMWFTVKDTGIGMSAEQIGRLFQPFMQADSSTTRRFGGTGLGLTIARHLCRLMGGDISVQSELDQGTTFTVQLPIERQRLMSPRF